MFRDHPPWVGRRLPSLFGSTAFPPAAHSVLNLFAYRPAGRARAGLTRPPRPWHGVRVSARLAETEDSASLACPSLADASGSDDERFPRRAILKSLGRNPESDAPVPGQGRLRNL
jgi:hypothetical protein